MTSLPRWSEGEGPSDPGLRAALSDARRGPSAAELTTLTERVAQDVCAREEAARSTKRAAWRPRAVAGLVGVVLALSAAWFWWSADPRASTGGSARQAEHTANTPTHQARSAPPVRPPVATPDRVLETAPHVANEPTHAPVKTRTPVPKRAQAERREAASPGDEVELLQAARRALLAQPEQALTLANQHATRFSQGLFVEEREAIVIEALFKLARLVQAERALTRFLHDYPQSSYRARLLRLHEERATPSP